MSRHDVLEILRSATATVRARFGVKRLALFGSVARDEGRTDSDVDVLVEFSGPVTLDRSMVLKFHLEDALGARVDLVSPSGLKARARPIVGARCHRCRVTTDGKLPQWISKFSPTSEVSSR